MLFCFLLFQLVLLPLHFCQEQEICDADDTSTATNDSPDMNLQMKYVTASSPSTTNTEDDDDDYLYATCDETYYAISCGVKYNNPTKSPVLWGAWPSPDGQSCICHANTKVDSQRECYANCAPKSIVSNYSILAKPVTRGQIVTCPNGGKVTGCGYKHTIHSFDYWKDVYPKRMKNKDLEQDIDEIEGCFCYSHYGATCYAICADNVVNHSFEKTTDQPYTETKCPQNTFVLGCGVKSNMKQALKYPASGYWLVNDSDNINTTKCAAYDQYGVISHAICGRFVV